MILNLLDNNLSKSNGFKFRTNATNFIIHFSVGNQYQNSNYFGYSFKEGFVILYKFVDEKYWFNLDVYAWKEEFKIDLSDISDGYRILDVLIYPPILSDLLEFTVEISDEFEVCVLDNYNKSLTVIGGLISSGFGCTTQSMLFSSMLQRDFNFNIRRMTFNNDNYLNELFTFLQDNKLEYSDIIIFEVDYTNQCDNFVDLYLMDILDILKMYSNNLICWMAIPPKKQYKLKKIKSLIGNDNDIIFEDLSIIYDELRDMCTFNEYFVNDSANIIIYKKFKEIIRRL